MDIVINSYYFTWIGSFIEVMGLSLIIVFERKIDIGYALVVSGVSIILLSFIITFPLFFGISCIVIASAMKKKEIEYSLCFCGFFIVVYGILFRLVPYIKISIVR